MCKTMETMDILEGKIKEALSRKTKLEVEHKNLLEEVSKLRDSVKKLERKRRYKAETRQSYREGRDIFEQVRGIG